MPKTPTCSRRALPSPSQPETHEPPLSAPPAPVRASSERVLEVLHSQRHEDTPGCTTSNAGTQARSTTAATAAPAQRLSMHASPTSRWVLPSPSQSGDMTHPWPPHLHQPVVLLRRKGALHEGLQVGLAGQAGRQGRAVGACDGCQHLTSVLPHVVAVLDIQPAQRGAQGSSFMHGDEELPQEADKAQNAHLHIFTVLKVQLETSSRLHSTASSKAADQQAAQKVQDLNVPGAGL